MVKHTLTIRQQKPTNCLSVFDHVVGLAYLTSISETVNDNLQDRKNIFSTPI